MFERSGKKEELNWKEIIKNYQVPRAWKSFWQIANSFLPFFILWYLMFLSLDFSYWLTLALSLPVAGFSVRIFIIQHDCGHGSFFRSKRLNDWFGMLCSIITLTPYHYWRKSHSIHHATAGKLEHRGIGDIYTMTVNEYLSKSRWAKLKYRLYRNPVILFLIIPSILFVFLYRFPVSRSKSLRKVEPSVYLTTLAILILFSSVIWLIGIKAFLLVQLPVTIISSSTGVWLFYMQHQFSNTYWDSDTSWDFTRAALQGSSYFKLPRILQWFTGNIGFHHIHHLSPRIPNYLLPKCHSENPVFQKGNVITLSSSLKNSILTLWDENQKKLVSFHQIKKLNKEVFI
jgi:acyl-lipid omega-6 desaturase (Delta-12 desaturase)